MKKKRPGQGTGHGTGAVMPAGLHERLLRHQARKVQKKISRLSRRYARAVADTAKVSPSPPSRRGAFLAWLLSGTR